MTRILVVDDEPDLQELIRQKFRKKIKENEYQFLFAENGVSALEVLDKSEGVDLILADINMPIMDGLTLLSRLNEKEYFLKTLIVSAYGDMENIRTAMNLGAFDFLTKPIDFRDLEVTMNKTIKHVEELKKSAETLRENDTLKIYLQEINAQKKLKDKFFSIISHDLRGPVSAFQGLSHILSMYIKRQSYDELQNTIDEVQSSTSQLSRLLDNLLSWASTELKELPYEPAKINARQLIDELADIFQSSFKAKGITFTNEIPEDVELYADQNSASTIFRNLINNALKFTYDGGIVKVTGEVENDHVSIAIIDNGVGMTQKKKATLFQLTAESTYGTKGEKGVGLGLKLVKEFTLHNKGKLNFESEAGKGSTFVVTLPLAK
jgi:signal transduction histidine kinase